MHLVELQLYPGGINFLGPESYEESVEIEYYEAQQLEPDYEASFIDDLME